MVLHLNRDLDQMCTLYGNCTGGVPPSIQIRELTQNMEGVVKPLNKSMSCEIQFENYVRKQL